MLTDRPQLNKFKRRRQKLAPSFTPLRESTTRDELAEWLMTQVLRRTALKTISTYAHVLASYTDCHDIKWI